ncbi:Oxoglutarate/iron-dependent dioxygenase [Corchorus olitorius]|uniref:Oxoglutarate/iron-dependent dioxygenase n=1 Tax=Corchorus olitorius TaxID=93759 RepID=A0A1R3JCT5_9ROSI|nr:Oxoglutarate/iron-dependent dioxygenase [Corchorus olitorius]
MASKVDFGNSLLVPCVQELAKDSSMTKIPPRYHHPDLQQTAVSGDGPTLEIPVIDMKSLLSEESMASELAKLDMACKQWGFFQLVNHGVSPSLLEKAKKEIQDLFNLPMEEKKKLWQTEGEIEGFGQSFVVSEEQKLDWGDLFFINTLPLHFRKPHLFPKLPLPLRDTLDTYSLELQNLAMTLLTQMAKALNIKVEEMYEFFEEGFQSFRINYYPPCPQPDKAIGLRPHSDAVGITILLQLNEAEGLQIKKDGNWTPVKPLPDAFIVNVGDILEMVTNGAYRSTEHRATVNSERERLSIATFYSPRYDGEVGPAPSLISPQNPAKFTTLKVEDYFKGLFARELQGKSYLDTMRIQCCI